MVLVNPFSILQHRRGLVQASMKAIEASVKYWVTLIVGTLTFPLLYWRNKLSIQNRKLIQRLPEKNVMFVANHQTYYFDGIAILHSLYASLRGFFYLRPNLPRNIYFVADKETMKKKGWLVRLLNGAGAILITRHWQKKGRVDTTEIDKIREALRTGWVIMFPQGTTDETAPGRKGVGKIIKQLQTVTVPVVINGFKEAFKQKKLGLAKAKTQLSIRFKHPLEIDYQNENSQTIIGKIMTEISPQSLSKSKT